MQTDGVSCRVFFFFLVQNVMMMIMVVINIKYCLVVFMKVISPQMSDNDYNMITTLLGGYYDN